MQKSRAGKMHRSIAEKTKKDIPIGMSFIWSGQRGSNSLPGIPQMAFVHLQEPCLTSAFICAPGARWRQRVRPSHKRKRTSRLGCPLFGAGNEARTRFPASRKWPSSICRSPASPPLSFARPARGGGSAFVRLINEKGHPDWDVLYLERATRLELATSTLARWRSTR